MKSQLDKIRTRLEAGKPITALQALKWYGCFRLAARIRELREQGLEIRTDTITTAKGKQIASYQL